MAHDTHAPSPDHAPHDAHAHPPLPPVTDEAPDSPMWLPGVGLALLVLFALYAMIRGAMGGDAADMVGADEGDDDDVAAVEAAEPPPAAEGAQ